MDPTGCTDLAQQAASRSLQVGLLMIVPSIHTTRWSFEVLFQSMEDDAVEPFKDVNFQVKILKPCRPVAFGVRSFISGWLGPCHEDGAQT